MVITRYSSSQPSHEGDCHFEGTTFTTLPPTTDGLGPVYWWNTPGWPDVDFDQSPVPILDGLERGVYSKGEK